MLKSFLSTPQEAVLSQALSVSSLRHKTISNNIANVNTPGFKRSEVFFEDKLQAALNGNRKLEMTQTHSHHLTGRQSSSITPAVVTDLSTSMRVDGNNVDIDKEMAAMAENSIIHDALSQQLGKYYSNLKSAISEGKR